MSILRATTVKVPIGVIGLVTPSLTREEESITSYSCYSLGWGLFACHWHRHQVQGTSVLRLIRRTRAIEVKQLAQGCKQTWQWWESNPQPSDHESKKLNSSVCCWAACPNWEWMAHQCGPSSHFRASSDLEITLLVHHMLASPTKTSFSTTRLASQLKKLVLIYNPWWSEEQVGLGVLLRDTWNSTGSGEIWTHCLLVMSPQS
jgi:hypothetical protein